VEVATNGPKCAMGGGVDVCGRGLLAMGPWFKRGSTPHTGGWGDVVTFTHKTGRAGDAPQARSYEIRTGEFLLSRSQGVDVSFQGCPRFQPECCHFWCWAGTDIVSIGPVMNLEPASNGRANVNHLKPPQVSCFC